MGKPTLAMLALLPFAASCTGGAPEPQPPTTPTPASEAQSVAPPLDPGAAVKAEPQSSAMSTSASAAPSTVPGLDLSTADKARATIYEVLRRGDKEAFRKCVSKRILERQSAVFDAWYATWKAAAEKGPKEFQKITVTQEDGAHKLDEN